MAKRPPDDRLKSFNKSNMRLEYENGDLFLGVEVTEKRLNPIMALIGFDKVDCLQPMGYDPRFDWYVYVHSTRGSKSGNHEKYFEEYRKIYSMPIEASQ